MLLNEHTGKITVNIVVVKMKLGIPMLLMNTQTIFTNVVLITVNNLMQYEMALQVIESINDNKQNQNNCSSCKHALHYGSSICSYFNFVENNLHAILYNLHYDREG